ncbi:uncharacterized protein J3R85_015331 [Psidium guajava]|nr:uncharacterized protein J3R85_015331 [Psidium guajava]
MYQEPVQNQLSSYYQKKPRTTYQLLGPNVALPQPNNPLHLPEPFGGLNDTPAPAPSLPSSPARSSSLRVVVALLFALAFSLNGKSLPLQKSSSALIIESLETENSKSDDAAAAGACRSCFAAYCDSAKSLEKEILGLTRWWWWWFLLWWIGVVHGCACMPMPYDVGGASQRDMGGR